MRSLVAKCSSILLVILVTGCGSARPYGVSRMDYLSEGVAENTPPDAMKKDLVRGAQTDQGVYVEAVPRTPAYARIKARETVAEEVFKTKMSWEKEEPLLEAADRKAIDETRKRACFDLEIRANSPQANDSKAWLGALGSEGKDQQGSFTPFIGFSQKTYTTLNGNTYVSTRYYSYTSLCFPKAINFQKPFVLVVEPRFARDIRPIRLEWREPRKS